MLTEYTEKAFLRKSALIARSVPFGHFATLLVSNARFLARFVLTST